MPNPYETPLYTAPRHSVALALIGNYANVASSVGYCTGISLVLGYCIERAHRLSGRILDRLMGNEKGP